MENDRCPNVLVFVYGMRRVLEPEESETVMTERKHEDSLTDKQGLYQRKKSDRVLKAYTRYVLG